MAAASDPRPTLFKSDDFVYDMENDWLGSGTFGEVYRCCLRDSGQRVALKVLSTPRRLKPK